MVIHWNAVGSLFSDKPIFITLWLFNIAMGNGPFIVDFPIKKKVFSIVMLVYQRVGFCSKPEIVAKPLESEKLKGKTSWKLHPGKLERLLLLMRQPEMKLIPWDFQC